jgi:hypothetical protein
MLLVMNDMSTKQVLPGWTATVYLLNYTIICFSRTTWMLVLIFFKQEKSHTHTPPQNYRKVKSKTSTMILSI